MWFRICFLLVVVLMLVNVYGIYCLVYLVLVFGWFDRFFNFRILLNRDYYNYFYWRLILWDLYWCLRIYFYRYIYFVVF